IASRPGALGGGAFYRMRSGMSRARRRIQCPPAALERAQAADDLGGGDNSFSSGEQVRAPPAGRQSDALDLLLELAGGVCRYHAPSEWIRNIWARLISPRLHRRTTLLLKSSCANTGRIPAAATLARRRCRPAGSPI